MRDVIVPEGLHRYWGDSAARGVSALDDEVDYHDFFTDLASPISPSPKAGVWLCAM